MSVAYVAVQVLQTVRVTVTETYSMSVAYVEVQVLQTEIVIVTAVSLTH